VFAVLFGFIKKVAGKETLAVVFRHDRFADLVIGRKDQVFFATRCMAFDTGDEQIGSLGATVSREIATCIQEQSITVKKILFLNWIDCPEAMLPMEDLDVPGFVFDEEPVTHGDTVHSVSFTRAIKFFPPLEGIGPGKGKLLYAADTLAPWIMGVLLVFTLALAWGMTVYQARARAAADRIVSVETAIHGMEKDLSVKLQQMEYQPALKFADTLFYTLALPSLKDVINDISRGVPDAARVDHITLEYGQRDVQIHIRGAINTEFDIAYQGYQQLLAGLEHQGYTVAKSRFTTRIDASRFELDLSWGSQ
jgi:hypothetical protein